MHSHKVLLLQLLLMFFMIKSVSAEIAVYFYKPQHYGSEVFYNPLNLSVGYSLDTAQLADNFDTRDLDERWKIVRDNLAHPKQAIDEEGGTKRFINRQIAPVDKDHFGDSYAIIPNFFLHLFGGGVVYRKNAEFFQENGYPYPRICAASIAMAAEVFQEVVEKKTTGADDEVADVYIYRPLGILLFSSDRVAGFVNTHLSPAVWPHLVVYDLKNETILNSGVNYIIRPEFLKGENVRFFSFIGLNNQIGLSHKTGTDTYLSWGVGLATTKIDLSQEFPAEVRISGGVFYDKNNSLIWSAIVNGTENLKFRLNVYPFLNPPYNVFGLFAGLSDEHKVSVGLSVNLPLGIGGTL
jgi:hypothetical protein